MTNIPKKSRFQVLIVDDEKKTRSALTRIVGAMGHDVNSAGSLAQARQLFNDNKPDVMIVDVMLPDGNGVELIEELNQPGVKFIVITGHPTLKIAVQALKTQVFDFIEKPVQVATIRKTVSRALASIAETGQHTKASRPADHTHTELTVRSPAMMQLSKTIDTVAITNANIFLYGESGTGKALVAGRIHAKSARTGQFVAVHCSSIAQEQALRDFFGQQAGAGDNAGDSHAGYLENAYNGTLLLDEVTEMPVDAQVQLLRVLETSKFRRLGSSLDIQAGFRVIATTNRDFKAAIEDGNLREDLYYRLAEISIKVPALRDRGDDISLITDQILNSLNRQYGKSKQISHSAREVLNKHNWPGNVRELRNVIHQSYLLSGPVINSQDVAIESQPNPAGPGANTQISNMLGKTFWEVEKELVFATLKQQQGDKEKTAQVLGISLKTLYNRLHAYS